MKFSILSQAFESIEKTTKRLEMTDILAELFKKANSKNIEQIIYLLQGKVTPSFQGLEIGIGEKFVQQAIAQATGYSNSEIIKLFHKKGDLGLVAEKLMKNKKQRALTSKELTVEHVYKTFLKIAKSSGTGSQQLKIKLLTELLNNSTPQQARYLARIPIDQLRLGVREATILDALSVMSAGDKSLREPLERGFNITSDLGLVAKTFLDKGLEAVEHIEMQANQPLQPALCERLPSSEEIINKIGKCAVEHKYDGIRCISGYTTLYERDKGLIAARDIKKGHYVLTHKGKFKKVIAINKRTIDKEERVFKFQTYLGNEFKITEKHRVLKYEKNREKWIPVENIKSQDWVVFPTPKIKTKEKLKKLELKTVDNYTKKIKIDNDFFKFLGYWVGDGYSNNYNKTFRVGLVLNKNHKKLINDYEKIIKNNLGITNISKKEHQGAVYMYWTDKEFLRWLAKNFKNQHKNEWKGKSIPDWFYNLSKEQFKNFLQGWIEADGNKNKDLIRITTKEKEMVSKAQLLCLKNGIVAGIKNIKVNGKTYYNLIIPKSNRKAKIINGKLLIKVLKNKELRRHHPREVDPRLKVYNLQVEDDESYCTTTIALHNCQIHKKGNKIEIYSRRQENLTHMFPDIIKEIKKLKQEELILDGEALSYNEETGEYLPFQQTIQRKRKYNIEKMKKDYPLHVFFFDIMFNGKDLTKKPFKERRKILEKTIHEKGPLKLSELIITDKPEELTKFFNEAVSKGLEGIIAKDLNAPYTVGARKFAWIKLKRSYHGELNDTVDVVIVGYYRGKGKRTEFGFGGFLGAVYNKEKEEFQTITRVGTGFSEEKMQELQKMLSKIKINKKHSTVNSLVEPDFWVEPKFVAELNADEITESPMHTAGMKKNLGYALRFPRLVKLRRDKSPEQATTVSEIIKMYKQQKRTKLEE